MREEDDSLKNEVQEPIYVNVNNRKQTSPVEIADLYDYILKNKENGCEGFKNEFQVTSSYLTFILVDEIITRL